MTDAIRTSRLTKHYGKKRVIDCLNLRVEQGKVYGFLGRNGAGKSTTIKMLLGMVQPDSGSAELLGEPADRLQPKTRERIAYIAAESVGGSDDRPIGSRVLNDFRRQTLS